LDIGCLRLYGDTTNSGKHPESHPIEVLTKFSGRWAEGCDSRGCTRLFLEIGVVGRPDALVHTSPIDVSRGSQQRVREAASGSVFCLTCTMTLPRKAAFPPNLAREMVHLDASRCASSPSPRRFESCGKAFGFTLHDVPEAMFQRRPYPGGVPVQERFEFCG